MFVYDKQDTILSVYPAISFHACIEESHRQYCQSVKWHNDGLYCRAYHWTWTSSLRSLQTVVSVSVAALESSCSPGGRGDFLLWGSSRTSAGCQAQLGMHSFSFSKFFTADTSVSICVPASWQNSGFGHCVLVSPPCCCNSYDNRAASSKQPQSILRLEGQDDGQIISAPCCM